MLQESDKNQLNLSEPPAGGPALQLCAPFAKRKAKETPETAPFVEPRSETRPEQCTTYERPMTRARKRDMDRGFDQLAQHQMRAIPKRRKVT